MNSVRGVLFLPAMIGFLLFSCHDPGSKTDANSIGLNEKEQAIRFLIKQDKIQLNADVSACVIRKQTEGFNLDFFKKLNESQKKCVVNLFINES